MGKVYEALTPELIEFIQAQQMFFVGSAPLSADGHVNLSPKGMDSLRVIDSLTLAYLDLTGSGAETIAHVRENGRLVMLFCAFEGSPLLLRVHGNAEVIFAQDPQFLQWRARFPEQVGVRSIIKLSATRIADSCGWTVPEYQQVGNRDYYNKYAEHKGVEGIRKSQLASNMQSIDQLPALTTPSC